MFWSLSDLPRVDSLEEYTPAESSKVYSIDNSLIAEYYLERRTFIPYYRIPEHVKQAFIAIEDIRFYEHHGIDFIRILGALYQDIKARAYVQGASTITQQLAKMLFLKPEKSIIRKVKEVFLSIQIERRYTKDEILGLYLNQAYFGTQAYGLVAASQTYFGKSVHELTIADAAMLAALPKAPSRYSPFRNPMKALKRRNLVLEKMIEYGFIDEIQYNVASSMDMPRKPYRRKYNAPYFVEHLRQVIEEKYEDELYSEGLKIYSTLDFRLQEIAESAVANGVEILEKRVDAGVQAALIAVDIDTGKVRAMVGGTDFWETQFNRVTQAMRQPGSAFKPIVYLAALDTGITPEDTIVDEEIAFQGNEPGEIWTPRNYYGDYKGEVTIRYALSHSLNTATACLADEIGVGRIVRTAKSLGLKSELKPYLTISLGVSDMTPLELAFLYKALADGRKAEPVMYDRIVDRNGITLEEVYPATERVIDEGIRLELQSMLRSVVTDGTGRKARSLPRPVYGKTGTTDDYTDAWFVGFDDEIALAVWIGRDDHTPIGGRETGSRAALPIWLEFMRRMYQ
ncbi:MAG: PBP1A family penicillin-binding protein [Nitrospirota bacterium]|nr:MAG: PBP1A family penicillin-binding protein [Nitrospirota bacterium]